MHVANFHTGSGDPASREGEEERRMSLSGSGGRGGGGDTIKK